MIPGERALARLRLADRNARGGGEGGERAFRAGVKHAAARDDQRRLGGAEQCFQLSQLVGIGRRRAEAPEAPFEEGGGVIERFGLHVLAEGEGHRAAIGRIEQGRHRFGQGWWFAACSWPQRSTCGAIAMKAIEGMRPPVRRHDQTSAERLMPYLRSFPRSWS